MGRAALFCDVWDFGWEVSKQVGLEDPFLVSFSWQVWPLRTGSARTGCQSACWRPVQPQGGQTCTAAQGSESQCSSKRGGCAAVWTGLKSATKEVPPLYKSMVTAQGAVSTWQTARHSWGRPSVP